MSAVMKINYILCQPCEPNTFQLSELYHSERINSCQSSVCSSPSTSTELPTHQRRLTGSDRRPTYTQTRTPWTPEEDDLLRLGYDQGLSWAMISATHLPHRSRGCCWGRFKTLQNKNFISKR
ncbi:hypothetical protein G6F37_011595 [Rhizopus arrhizus]|nr:hypothetical protein G6F38_011682 [Rhizopus arrhizus]KAG1148494.1 hypothetical protein G6F37_011595 [Rhizopus arrhizus]